MIDRFGIEMERCPIAGIDTMDCAHSQRVEVIENTLSI
jgi:hypothetical protein